MLTSPDALRAVIDFLADHHVSYMLIGGLANAVWGEVRATHDADFKVSIDLPLAEFRDLVLDRFPERQTQIPPHLRSPYVLHIWAAPGVAVDIFVSVFEYERLASAATSAL